MTYNFSAFKTTCASIVMILISYFGSIVHVEDKQETEESKESIKKNQMTIILTDLTEEKQERSQ